MSEKSFENATEDVKGPPENVIVNVCSENLISLMSDTKKLSQNQQHQ